MSAPTVDDLTDAQRNVVAAWRALCTARQAAWRSPNADNLRAETDCEYRLNVYLDRLPRIK